MAANKFASMLHRNGHKMAAVLVYTLLEWTLIILLLLNGLFSYLIAKFAAFFGLAPPCAACSRVDHLFEPGRSRPSLADLLCDAHAAELSGLAFCRHHHRLAEASDMCEDCSSSRPRVETDRTSAMLSWMRRSEQGEKDLSCSCCSVVLESGFYSPYLLMKPSSWGVLEQYDDGQKEAESKDIEGRNLSSLADADTAATADAPNKGHEAVIAEEETEEERVHNGEDAIGMVDMEPVPKEEVVELMLREQKEGEGSFVLFSDAYKTEPDASLDAVVGCQDDACYEERLFPVEFIDSATVASCVVLPQRHVLVGDEDANGFVAKEHDNRAINTGDSLELREALDSAAEEDVIAKVISSYGIELLKVLSSLMANGNAIVANSPLKDVEQQDLMTGIGCLTKERNKLSDADRVDIGEPKISGHDVIEKNVVIFDVGSASDEKKELALATDSTEMRTAILEEENALVSPVVMADLIDLNSSGQEVLEQDAMILDDDNPLDKENMLISYREIVETIEENSRDNEFEQCASTLDDGLVEEKSLSLDREMADLIDLSSYLQDGIQQDAVTPDVISTLDKVNASTTSIEMNDIHAGEQQNFLSPDVGISKVYEKELAYDMGMSNLVELESIEQDGHLPDSEVPLAEEGSLPADHGIVDFVEECPSVPPGAVGDYLSDHDNILQEMPDSEVHLEEEGGLPADHGMTVFVEKRTPVLPGTVGDHLSDHDNIRKEMPKEAFLNDGVQVDALILEKDIHEQLDTEKDDILADGETNCEISIGSEICDQEHVNNVNFNESISISDNGQDQGLLNFVEVSEMKNECPEHASGPDSSEVEEDRAPETPTYVDDLNNLQKRFLLGRRESGTESLDGSVASEVECSEVLTTEQLKFALKSERKALYALYAELEEERSAAAIAANQTMAMITRLHEEKAAMQMEALQYQRMMEEQSEYDQEALHLLNELMMKREKEKQELEKELEVYRKKVRLYEAKERRRIKEYKANGRTGASTASSAEDSDDLSSEFHEGDECGHSIDEITPLKKNIDEITQNTPSDVVLISGINHDTSKHLTTLNESLAGFEEERLSILEQLKVLEEKLFTLEEEDSYNMESMEHLTDENGHLSNGEYEYLSDDLHDGLNGFSYDLDSGGKVHSESTDKGYRGKRLLPLFDAIDNENEDSLYIKEETLSTAPGSISKLAKEQKKLEIVEEVDTIYERLQALEADREFLKHCISSLKKGDKGTQLLQEILEHLRDLRNVELQVRNVGDALTSS